MLPNYVGVEGQRLYRTLSESTGTSATTAEVRGPRNGDASPITPAAATTFYDGALSKLMKFFTPAINKATERYKFHLCSQRSGKGGTNYVAALRGLTETCGFGSLTKDIICDQLIEKTCMPQIRDHLLLEADIKLEDAVVIATQVDQAVKEFTLLQEGTTVHSL